MTTNVLPTEISIHQGPVKMFISHNCLTGETTYGSPEIEHFCKVHDVYHAPARAMAGFLFRMHRRIARALGAKW